MEVLIAATVGFVVLAATLGLLESTVRLNTGVMAKTDAMQRGRARHGHAHAAAALAGLPRLGPLRRSSRARPRTRSRSTPTTRPTASKPVKRTITLRPGHARRIRSLPYDRRRRPRRRRGDHVLGDGPTATNLVLENAGPAVGRRSRTRTSRSCATSPTRTSSGVAAAPSRSSRRRSTPPRRRASRASTSPSCRRPTGAKDSKKAVNLGDQIMARHADPNLSRPRPEVRMTRRLRLAAEDGYTMAAVMLVMLATSIMAERDVRGGGRGHPVHARLAGPQAGVRRRRGRGRVLPLPADARQRLLEDVRHGARPRRPAEPGQPVEPAATPAAGATVAGTTDAQFSIELLPANGKPRCEVSTTSRRRGPTTR